LIFHVLPLRFEFTARERIVFPAGKAGNVFRGALGMALQRVPGAYEALFQPPRVEGPSGLADSPRPFVLRAAHLDGQSIAPGGRFTVFIHVFHTALPAAGYFAAALRGVAEEGIGPARGVAQLSVQSAAPVAINLAAAGAARRIRVAFETPIELKAGGELAPDPDFHILFARVRDRVSTLRRLYQGGALPIDFRETAARAATVRLGASKLSWETTERYSTRTGQTHPLGGMTGWAEYEGELGEFLPYLEAGYWTGAGRQTVWGKGVIRTAVLE
jgi:hypothetical protein